MADQPSCRGDDSRRTDEELEVRGQELLAIYKFAASSSRPTPSLTRRARTMPGKMKRAGKDREAGSPRLGRQTFKACVLEKWSPHHLLEPGVHSNYSRLSEHHGPDQGKIPRMIRTRLNIGAVRF